jgi:hypothetical protein
MKINKEKLKEMIREAINEGDPVPGNVPMNPVPVVTGDASTQRKTSQDQAKKLVKGGVNKEERIFVNNLVKKLTHAAREGTITTGVLEIHVNRLNAALDKVYPALATPKKVGNK